jgi:integrase
MAGKRTRHARGSLALNKRASGEHVWMFRYMDAGGKYRGIQFATIKQCRTRSQARIEADSQRLPEKYIGPAQAARNGRKTFGQLVARYKTEEMPERFSTAHSYKSWLDLHIAPKWEKFTIEDVEPGPIEGWLKELALSPKSKAHIRGLMTILFDRAMNWKWIPYGRNPMEFVTIKGGAKRKTRPAVLTVEQWAAYNAKVTEQHIRVIGVVSMCLGLRLSEVLALKWLDIDWSNLEITISRGIVQGREDRAKTEYSEAPVPLDPQLAEILLQWKRETGFPAESDWLFASPFQCGRKPYFPTAVRRKIHTAAKAAGLEALFVGEPTKIMRHSYRSWLGTTDTPLAMIKDLMRHADVRTTFNDYGNGMQPAMRTANSKVVRMVLKTG